MAVLVGRDSVRFGILRGFAVSHAERICFFVDESRWNRFMESFFEKMEIMQYHQNISFGD